MQLLRSYLQGKGYYGLGGNIGGFQSSQVFLNMKKLDYSKIKNYNDFKDEVNSKLETDDILYKYINESLYIGNTINTRMLASILVEEIYNYLADGPTYLP
jgi:hypothetical protein